VQSKIRFGKPNTCTLRNLKNWNGEIMGTYGKKAFLKMADFVP